MAGNNGSGDGHRGRGLGRHGSVQDFIPIQRLATFNSSSSVAVVVLPMCDPTMIQKSLHAGDLRLLTEDTNEFHHLTICLPSNDQRAMFLLRLRLIGSKRLNLRGRRLTLGSSIGLLLMTVTESAAS